MKLSNTKIFFSPNLVTVRWNEPLANATLLMKRHSVRHLPVIDDSNSVIGIVSDRDVKLIREDFFKTDTAVVSHMSFPVVTIDINSSFGDAAQIMVEKNISAVIVTEGETAVGITTTHDILKALVAERKTYANNLTENLKTFVTQSPLGAVMQRLADVGL